MFIILLEEVLQTDEGKNIVRVHPVSVHKTLDEAHEKANELQDYIWSNESSPYDDSLGIRVSNIHGDKIVFEKIKKQNICE